MTFIPPSAPPHPMPTSAPLPYQDQIRAAFSAGDAHQLALQNAARASAVNATAFTAGNQVQFAPGAGRPMLPHESVHVVAQQGNGYVPPGPQHPAPVTNRPPAPPHPVPGSTGRP